MKFLAKIFPILPLSFILLIFSLEISIIEEEYEEDMYDEEVEENSFIRVAVVEDKAYWVSNNVFYEADYVDDEIVKEDAHPVDAFDMNFRDVSKMMIILDSIQDKEE